MKRVAASQRVSWWTTVLIASALPVLVLSGLQQGAAQTTPAPAASEPAVLIEGLPTKMGRRIVSTLRQAHGAMPRVVRASHQTQPDGAEKVFLAYEYSEMEACVSRQVAGGSSREDSRVNCRDSLGADACTVLGAAFVTVAATPARRPAGTGGDIAVVFDVAPRAGCRTHSIVDLAQRDLDGDGRVELLLDVVGINIERGFRSGQPLEQRVRSLAIWDEAGREQLATRLGAWGPTDEEMATASVAARWAFRDTNRDRRQDVVVDHFEYEEAGGCPDTPLGWFEPVDNGGGECDGELEHSTFLYDVARDVWIE